MTANHERQMLFNGELRPAAPQRGPYVFQNVHTLGGECRRLQRHVEVLTAAAEQLFGIDLDLAAREAGQQARRLAEACRLTRNVTVRLIVKAYPSGDVSMEYDEPSIYRGYVLRSLRPDTVCVNMAPPLWPFPTSAAVETRALADATARARGFHTAVLTDAEGNLVSESARPIFVVRGYTLLTPPCAAMSVERETAELAAREASLAVVSRPLTRDDLASADEVLTVNYQGVTSIARIDGKPYMSIIAEKLAECMEAAVR